MLFIFALIVVTLATAAMLLNRFKLQTLFHCRLFDRTFYWPNCVVDAQIESIEYDRGEYAMICRLANGKKVALPASEQLIKTLDPDEKIYLNQYQFPKGYGYIYAPISKFKEKFNISTNDHTDDINAMMEFSIKARTLHTVSIVLYILAILCIKAAPSTSIFLAASAIILFLNIIPCKRWTNYTKMGIIISANKKISASQQKVVDQTGFPDGYSNWSDNQKELYAIQQKVSETIQDQKKNEEAKENFDTPINIEEKENAPSEVSKAAPRSCKVCGCIVSQDARFCDHCGASLELTPEEPGETVGKGRSDIAEKKEELEAESPGETEDSHEPDNYEEEDEDDYTSMASGLGLF